MKIVGIIPNMNIASKKAVDSVDFKGIAEFIGAAAPGATTGATPIVLGTIPAGDNAPLGGTISITGCKAVQLDLNILIGDDCLECTADTLTLLPKTYVFDPEPNGGTIIYELPEVFYGGDVEVTLLDATGAPVDCPEGLSETVKLTSCWAPNCPTGYKVVPA